MQQHEGQTQKQRKPKRGEGHGCVQPEWNSQIDTELDNLSEQRRQMTKRIADGIEFFIQCIKKLTMVGAAEELPSGPKESAQRIAKESTHHGILDTQDCIANRNFQRTFQQIKRNKQNTERPESKRPAESRKGTDYDLCDAARVRHLRGRGEKAPTAKT